jgi:CheY-specific phosphatase CheX
MTDEVDLLGLALHSLAQHTQVYFSQTLQIPLSEPVISPDMQGPITLLDLTALMALGGPVSIMVAFSVQSSLAREIQTRETQGLGIPPEEMNLYLEGALGEVLNVVAGHCTADLNQGHYPISLTPPVVIDSPRLIARPAQTRLGRTLFTSPMGELQISCAAPREPFIRHFFPAPAPVA